MQFLNKEGRGGGGEGEGGGVWGKGGERRYGGGGAGGRGKVKPTQHPNNRGCIRTPHCAQTAREWPAPVGTDRTCMPWIPETSPPPSSPGQCCLQRIASDKEKGMKNGVQKKDKEQTGA